MNGMVGFSLNAASAATSLAASVQFANTGVIDARNGGSFAASQSVSYAAGSTYHFRLVINLANHTYSVFVTPAGGAEITLGVNYAFRPVQAKITTLNDWAAYGQNGTESVCNMAIAAGSGGSGATAPSITTQPSSAIVTAGGTATFSVTATGTAPLTYQWSKNGFAISGAASASYTTPATTAADNGSSFTVVVGNGAGSVTSSAATLTVTSAATAPSITVQPSNATVAVGKTATFSVTATGTAPLSYQWRKSGTAISGATSASYTTPATTAADNGSSFTVVVGNGAGSVTSSAATLTVITSPAISWTPPSLSFGNVNVGSSSTLAITISSTGTATTTISADTISGAGFSAAGVPPLAGLMLPPGQTATLNVTFAPSSAGSISGNAVINSNAANSPMASIPLSATGVQPASHEVILTWGETSSGIAGYNVYRGAVSGGPYARQNPSLVSAFTYTDTAVIASDTYFYVVTAVDSSGQESSFSNQASATIPTP
jgi:hypothetical protein